MQFSRVKAEASAHPAMSTVATGEDGTRLS